MANKREFKKTVEAIGSGVCADMLTNYYIEDGISREVADNCINKVLMAVENARNNANVFFDKGPRAFGDDRKAYNKARKDFFRQLFARIDKDFVATVEEALKEFNAAIPADVKERNKKAVMA